MVSSRLFVLVVLGFLLVDTARAQGIDLSFLQTRAEESGYVETSRYDEVTAFVDIVANASPMLHRTTFGYSFEGRPLPLVVYGDVADASPRAVHAAPATRVLVLGNIHAGEVAGKEAALMMLRALAAGRHASWADSLVVLFAPIYNADGNERVRLTNRPKQYGPFGGMGQRPNAQNYDLNRDFMKLDAPETRSLVRLMTQYDPHVVVDLHTTNGSYHGYHLTYAPPLHPATPAPVDAFLREHLLPEVTHRIEQKYDWDYYYYGNVPQPGSSLEKGWYTFDHRPRFGTNYAGLRNRMGILSEAYAYLSFEDRILASYYFVEEILQYVYENAGDIRRVIEQADATSVVGSTLPVRATYRRSDERVDILMGEVEQITHPYTGEVVLRRLDVQRVEPMYEYGQFSATETVTGPFAYLLPDSLHGVVERLAAHGIRMEVLERDTTLTIERFRVDSVHVASRPYQGHTEQTLYGAYETVETVVPAGYVRVPVEQPLGRLAVLLLEPRSDDGIAAWNLVSMYESGPYYPIVRVSNTP